MPGDSVFFDSLSIFSVLGLFALVLTAALWLGRDQVGKRTALARAKEGLGELRQAAHEIRSLTDPYAPKGADVEMFLLAALMEKDIVDKHRVSVLARRFAPDPTDGETFSYGVFQLSSIHRASAALQTLDRARQKLGTVPAAALEYVLRTNSDLGAGVMVGPASHIVGYLQRCDLVDRAVAAAPTAKPGTPEAGMPT